MGRAYADSSERLSYSNNHHAYRDAAGYGDDVQQQQFAAYWQQAAWEEASRLADGERERLESELQAKLDLVAMDLDEIESINRAAVRSLRFKVFFFFVLAAGIAGGSSWYYMKRLRPQLGALQAQVALASNEQSRLARELDEKTESARTLQQKYDAMSSDLERLRGGKGAPQAAAPKPAPAVPSDPAPTSGDVKAAAPPEPKPPAPVAKAETRTTVAAVNLPAPPQAKTIPAVVVQKAKPCKCKAGDPMCGCI
jgi:hypothetical protein